MKNGDRVKLVDYAPIEFQAREVWRRMHGDAPFPDNRLPKIAVGDEGVVVTPEFNGLFEVAFESGLHICCNAAMVELIS